MRLRPALMTCVIAALAVVGARLTTIAFEREFTERNDRQRETVEVIARDAAGLLVLTQDYGLYRSERAARQWRLVHQRLSRALADYAATDAASAQQVEDLQDTGRALPQIFDALREASQLPANAPDGAVRRETLNDQLVNETRRVSDGAFELSRDLVERRHNDAVRQRWLAVATQATLLALTLLLAGLLLRRVLSPIDQLRRVAKAVEGGDLAARSGLKNKDELGQLSQALDAMTAALQQRDAALRRNEAFLERANQLAGIGGWELELSTGRLSWAAQTYAIHGLAPGSAIDTESALRCFTSESQQRLREAMDTATTAGEGWDLELALDGPDGERRWLRSVGAAECDADGRALKLVGAVQDITARRAADDALRHALQAADAASAAKSEFLANMSHEIRTPMNAVMGLSFLLGRTSLDDEQRDLLSKVSSASRSLLDVINAVLDLSKIEAGEMVLEATPFDPAALLQDIAGLFRPQADVKAITLALTLEAGLPPLLLGDAARLRQIVGNLLSNAIKFTAEGHVGLSARCLDPQARPLKLEIAVQDSGIGIPAEALSRIFTPFTQADSSTSRRFGGTGLGLSIVKQLCGLMGGHVDVSSSPGAGTRFVVQLSFEPAQGQHLPARGTGQALLAGAHGSTAVQRLPGVRVLVADDSDLNLEVVRRILEEEGAVVTLAPDGAVAVAQLRAQPRAFDIVLMDVQMPVLDGLDAARRIRADLGLHDLPILALTAGALLSERQRALEAGMNGFVSKPFDPEGLMQLLREQVERVQGRPLPVTARHGEPASAAAWPALEGIDGAEARQRLQDDTDFFAQLLGRLLDEFKDLMVPAALDAPQAAARLHKLAGSAGLLAARPLRDAARRGETRARSGADARTELAEVGRLLQALAAQARPWLQARRLQPPPAGATLPLDAGALSRLRQALQAQDLTALELFKPLAPALDAACGTTAFGRLQRALDSLDFAAALRELSGLPGGAGSA